MADSKPAPARKPTRRRLSFADRNVIALCRRWLGRCSNSQQFPIEIRQSTLSRSRKGDEFWNLRIVAHDRRAAALLVSLFTPIRRPSCASLILTLAAFASPSFAGLPLAAHRAAAPNRWIIGTCEALHFADSWDLLSDFEALNGDRSTQNKIAIRGTLPHRYSIEPLDGSGLAVRTIFLLSVQEDGHRLVYAIRLDDEFDWSGDNLQTSLFL